MRLLLFSLVALSLAGALPGVQSCCVSVSEYPGDGYTANVAFQRDLHFDRVPSVLTVDEERQYLACRQRWHDEAVAANFNGGDLSLFPEYWPYTYPGNYDTGCNVFGCHCDHCYLDRDCTGDADGDPKKQYERWMLFGKNPPTPCPALSSFKVPGYTGSCVPAAGASVGASTTTATATTIAAAERACADRNEVLNATLPELTARLSSLYCAKGAADSVGLEFTGSLLASLDADKSGSVDCAEWGIAKQTTALQQLAGGGYFGPAKLAAPLCKLSADGRDTLARYNAYLGRLTLATLATNATAAVASAASRAAVTVENELVAGSAAGALLAARDKVVAAWNATAATTSGNA